VGKYAIHKVILRFVIILLSLVYCYLRIVYSAENEHTHLSEEFVDLYFRTRFHDEDLRYRPETINKLEPCTVLTSLGQYLVFFILMFQDL
jgi:hypothetical protein